MKISTTKIWMGVEWKGHRSEVRRRKFNRVEDRTKLWNSLVVLQRILRGFYSWNTSISVCHLSLISVWDLSADETRANEPRKASVAYLPSLARARTFFQLPHRSSKLEKFFAVLIFVVNFLAPKHLTLSNLALSGLDRKADSLNYYYYKLLLLSWLFINFL